MYQKKDYGKAVKLAEGGKLCLESLVTETFPLQSNLNAYQDIEKAKDKAMKVMIDVG